MAQHPSLNKEHGFMKSIIKNQIDRDEYDKEIKAAKQKERTERRSQISGRSKRPDQAIYVPPLKNQECRARAVLFRLEYEDEWGKFHELDIRRSDDPFEIAFKFGRDQDLDDGMILALGRKLEHEMVTRMGGFIDSSSS